MLNICTLFILFSISLAHNVMFYKQIYDQYVFNTTDTVKLFGCSYDNFMNMYKCVHPNYYVTYHPILQITLPSVF